MLMTVAHEPWIRAEVAAWYCGGFEIHSSLDAEVQIPLSALIKHIERIMRRRHFLTRSSLTLGASASSRAEATHRCPSEP